MYNAKNIKVQMVLKGVSVADLAEKTGLTETSIYAILRGGDTRVSSLQKIADALSCSIADFCLPAVDSKLRAEVEAV